MPGTYVSWKTPFALKMHRVAKFKQRAVLLGSSAPQGMPGVGNGACIGLVFAWLRRRLQQPTEAPKARAEHLCQEDTLYKVDVDCSSFNGGYRHAGSRVDRLLRAAPNICGMSGRSAVEAQGKDGLATLVAHLDETLPGYYILEFTYEEVPVSHGCALYVDENGMSFFDPNSGEYRIGHRGKLAFFQQLYNHYRNYVSSEGVKAERTIDALFLVQFGRM
ncbi:YopT-type cysteine protease domain-containing protein [Pseudomonas sp. NPDC089554]|uniref:YopT-type cysteine protease domain-containing protein n=1 Tax=Pseudomonas sp. NPDC089554 TaxID=3390653 RepID=UPI003D023829